VQLNDSSLLMLRQIAARVDAAGAARFDAHVDLLRRAIAGGEDPMEQGHATLHQAEQVLSRIVAHQRFSTDDLRMLLDGLLAQGIAGQYNGYQGAEQATMAVQSMTDSLSRSGVLPASAVEPALRRLMASVAEDEPFRPEAFQSALRELRAALEGSGKR
jgi:hypothetical protein